MVSLTTVILGVGFFLEMIYYPPQKHWAVYGRQTPDLRCYKLTRQAEWAR